MPAPFVASGDIVVCTSVGTDWIALSVLEGEALPKLHEVRQTAAIAAKHIILFKLVNSFSAP